MAKTKTDGPRSWIFLRGLARCSQHWGPFLRIFQERFPQDEVELLDLAGNGTEINRPSYLHLGDNVNDLRERSRFLREGRELSLLSVSLGSMVALDWAERYPGEVQNVVVMNTSDGGQSPFYERMQPRNLFSLPPVLSPWISAEKIESAVLKRTTNQQEDLPGLARFQATLPQTKPGNIIRQLWAASRFSLPKDPPPARLMFMVSQKDRLVHPNCTRRIARKWNCDLNTHPKAGHDLTLDDPRWVCDKIAKIWGP